MSRLPDGERGAIRRTHACISPRSRAAGRPWLWPLFPAVHSVTRKRLRYPDRGLRIPNGWNATPDEHFRKGADKFWEAVNTLASL